LENLINWGTDERLAWVKDTTKTNAMVHFQLSEEFVDRIKSANTDTAISDLLDVAHTLSSDAKIEDIIFGKKLGYLPWIIVNTLLKTITTFSELLPILLEVAIKIGKIIIKLITQIITYIATSLSDTKPSVQDKAAATALPPDGGSAEAYFKSIGVLGGRRRKSSRRRQRRSTSSRRRRKKISGGRRRRKSSSRRRRKRRSSRGARKISGGRRRRKSSSRRRRKKISGGRRRRKSSSRRRRKSSRRRY